MNNYSIYKLKKDIKKRYYDNTKKMFIKCNNVNDVDITFKRLINKFTNKRILTLRILNYLNIPGKKCLYVLCIYE